MSDAQRLAHMTGAAWVQAWDCGSGRMFCAFWPDNKTTTVLSPNVGAQAPGTLLPNVARALVDFRHV